MAAALAGYLAVVPGGMETFEGQWIAFAPAAAALVWLVAQLPQLPAAHPLVRWGEYSYGVYLVHAPAMAGVFYLLRARGWLLDSTTAVVLAGVVALTAGFLFGRVEVALHLRLRPLIKFDYAGAARRLVRATIRPPVPARGR